eukprot:12403447-Karenia_brevis.AAC.1
MNMVSNHVLVETVYCTMRVAITPAAVGGTLLDTSWNIEEIRVRRFIHCGWRSLTPGRREDLLEH